MESTMFSISSIITVGSGVLLLSLAALGVVTGGVALGILGFIGAVAGVLSFVMVLFAVFEGAKERAVSSFIF
jgi:hypothetical protein